MRLAAGLAVAMLAARVAAAEPISEPVALLQGLDKTTARISRFEVRVGTPGSFGDLTIVLRDCQRSPPEETPENAAFLEIYELRPGEEKVRLFSGWMFSSSPALSALEHAVYDLNVLECRAASGSAAPPPGASTPPPTATPRGKVAR